MLLFIVDEKKTVKRGREKYNALGRDTGVGEFCRFQKRRVGDGNIIGVTRVGSAGKSKVPCFTFMDDKVFWFVVFRMAGPGSVVDIVGKMMKNQVALLSMNLADIAAGLQMEVRAASEGEQ